jgi:hypothetical protein
VNGHVFMTLIPRIWQILGLNVNPKMQGESEGVTTSYHWLNGRIHRGILSTFETRN